MDKVAHILHVYELARELHERRKEASAARAEVATGALIGAGLSQLRMPGKNKKPLSLKQRATRAGMGAAIGGGAGFVGGDTLRHHRSHQGLMKHQEGRLHFLRSGDYAIKDKHLREGLSKIHGKARHAFGFGVRKAVGNIG